MSGLRVIVLHGVNLDQLGRRDPGHYGSGSLNELEGTISEYAAGLGHRVIFEQTNFEGEYVELLHKAPERGDAIILNPGAWTHYAWAIHDALELTGLPAVEVHLSDVKAREEWRHHSVISDLCIGTVAGKGPEGSIAFVTDLIDVRWLTGLSASNALVAVTADRAWLLTDFRYLTAADEVLVDGLELEIASDLLSHAAGLAKEAGVTKVLLPKDKITLGEDAKLAGLLGDDIERVPGPRFVDALRAVKTDAEVEAIAAAQALADAAFTEAILERGIIGRTEREVALDLEFTMRRLGAETVSFDSIIAAGAHGALPHANPRDVAIPKHELVVIDWGAQLDGYCSDCTRTVATGSVDEKRQEIHALVRAAQDASLKAIRVGASGKAVDEEARVLIAEAGHGDHFGHGLGHGVGLEVHEGPNLSPRSVSTLAVGNIVTVEPGVYLPGEFGVRVEELVAVTPIGPRILTSLPREAADVS